MTATSWKLTQPTAQPPAEPAGALALSTSAPIAPSVSVFANIDQFEEAQRMAAALCSSTIVPKDYQGQANLGNCLIALDMAGALAMRPMTVMQNLHVINGKPSFGSPFLIGQINTCGRFSSLEFVLDDPSSPTSCYAVATSIATGRELVGELVTIEMAKAQGWWTRTGSKWPSMTGQMLRYRAAAFWQRVYAPELTLGMRTMEEAQDVDVVTVSVEPAAQAPAPETKPARTRARKAAAAPTPSPEPEPAAQHVLAQQPTVEAVLVPEVEPETAPPAPTQQPAPPAPEPETREVVQQGLAAVIAEVTLRGLTGIRDQADGFLEAGDIDEAEHNRLLAAVNIRADSLGRDLTQFEVKSAVAKLQADPELEQQFRDAFEVGAMAIEQAITQRQHVETIRFFIEAKK